MENLEIVIINQTLLPKIEDYQSNKNHYFLKYHTVNLKCEIITKEGKSYYLKQPQFYLKPPQFYLKWEIIPSKIHIA